MPSTSPCRRPAGNFANWKSPWAFACCRGPPGGNRSPKRGELLYRRAVQVLADLEQVEQQLLRKSAVVSGQLRVTTPISLGRRRIAPLLAEFCALHPELQVQIELSDSVLDLVASGMDFAVRFGGLEDSSYISRPLAPNHRVLCASPEYIRRHGEPRSPADLAHHHCLLIGQQSQADWRFEEVTVRISARLVASDGEVVHQWALDGHGIALKSIWDVADDLRSGRLRQVLAGHRIPAAPLHAIYPHKHHVAPRVRACIDYLAAHLRGPQGEAVDEPGNA
ncbi:substrate binding domain-containing protein [Azotobacter vinelandii]